MTNTAIRSGIDLSHVDDSIRPQDDLFGHVNGRWLAEYEIPADRATDGAFRQLYDRAEEQVRDLIGSYLDGSTSPTAALMIRIRRLSDRFVKVKSARSAESN